MKSKLGLIGLIVCGLAGLGLIVGLIAGLAETLIRLCGVVLLAALAFTAYRLVKERNA